MQELPITTQDATVLTAFVKTYREVVNACLDFIWRNKATPSVLRKDTYRVMRDKYPVVTAHIQTAIGIAVLLRKSGVRTIDPASNCLRVQLRRDTYDFCFDGGVLSLRLSTLKDQGGRITVTTNLVAELPPINRTAWLWEDGDNWFLGLE